MQVLCIHVFCCPYADSQCHALNVLNLKVNDILWSLQADLHVHVLTLNVNIMFKCSESQSQYHFRQSNRTCPYADSQCHALNVLNLKVNDIYDHALQTDLYVSCVDSQCQYHV